MPKRSFFSPRNALSLFSGKRENVFEVDYQFRVKQHQLITDIDRPWQFCNPFSYITLGSETHISVPPPCTENLNVAFFPSLFFLFPVFIFFSPPRRTRGNKERIGKDHEYNLTSFEFFFFFFGVPRS